MPLFARLASGLTARRIRAHGIILALCMWLPYAYNLSPPGLWDRQGHIKGTDFVHFYTLGTLALEHRASDLYDTPAQERLIQQLVPGARGLYYVALYGPQVSLFFAPFAWLPYAWALTLWWVMSTLIYGACCYLVFRTCPRLQEDRPIVLILAFAYPAFFHLIAWGQTSAPAVLCFTASFLALRKGRDFVAGLALGLLAFKPPLALAAGVVFLLAGEWKLIAGAAVSAATQMAVGGIYYGIAVLRQYLAALRNVPHLYPYLEPRPYAVHSLRSFWAILAPWPEVAFLLYLISAGVVLWLTIRIWRGPADFSLRYSALLFATALVAPHLTVYDLVILAPALLLLADWTMAHIDDRYSPGLRLLLYLSYALPLFGPVTRWTHVQLSVLAFIGVMIWLGRLAERESKKVAAA
ncbi:MAG TPA: glycosyltransferase family 87 protein [Terriglobales bacterium]